MKIWTLFFLFFGVCVFGYYPNFENNPLLPLRTRDLMERYLLPLDHPLKPQIDHIFSQSRVTESKQAILDAGFSIIVEMPRSLAFVVRHPQVPGYVFKMHLDSEVAGRNGIPSWRWLTQRCEGARKIRKIIRKHGIRHFIVPDKWLYVLPHNADVNIKTSQPVVLIASDIEVQSRKASAVAWRKEITRRHLDELYLILKPGLGSIHLDSNVLYTKDGVFAFVDTEKPKESYRLKKAAKYFSKKMQKYWLDII